MFTKLGSTGGATPPVGGGTDKVFYINEPNITTNYTLEDNKNALSAGPITIASGIVVTISPTATWTVV